MPVCAEQDCQKPVTVRGICTMHYGRLRRAGKLVNKQSRGLPMHERFELHVDRSDADGCHVWTGFCNRDGYGMFSVNRTHSVLAHRFAWEHANGQPVPDGKVVMHTCDNPPCVRREHLVPGTQIDNINDMLAKGRGKSQK